MRGDDAAEGVAAGQDNAAVVDFNGGSTGRVESRQERAFNQRATAGRTPVRFGVFVEDGMALAADSLHVHKGNDWPALVATPVPPQVAPAPPQVAAGARYTGDMHSPVRLVAIDMDGTLLPTFSGTISQRNAKALKAAQEAGMIVAIATGRRMAYTAPLLDGLALRADMPLITSNGAVTRTLGGGLLDRSHLDSKVARGICGLLRPFGALVFTFDRPGHGELVLEDLEQAHGRIALWVESNRGAIEVMKPLERALVDGDDPIQGMLAGGLSKMRQAEKALKASEWSTQCESVRTEYPARDLSILDLLPQGVSKGWALERLAGQLGVDRKETMAIGDNWNDVDMLEWAGQSILMGNAAQDLRTMARMRGWKQAPPNDEDGVAVVLEAAVARRASAKV